MIESVSFTSTAFEAFAWFIYVFQYLLWQKKKEKYAGATKFLGTLKQYVS